MTSFTDAEIKRFITPFADETVEFFATQAVRLARTHRRQMRAYGRTPAWRKGARRRKGRESGYRGRDALIFAAVAETLRHYDAAASAKAPLIRLRDVKFKDVRRAFSAAEETVGGRL